MRTKDRKVLNLRHHGTYVFVQFTIFICITCFIKYEIQYSTFNKQFHNSKIILNTCTHAKININSAYICLYFIIHEIFNIQHKQKKHKKYLTFRINK